MIAKTNVSRVLERAGVPHELVSCDVDPSDLSAETVAERIGLSPERVFKTLLTKADDGEYLLCCVPANLALDPRKAAKAAGKKSVDLAPLADLEKVTGYVRGGCSPLGTKRSLRVFVDETAILHERISVSAGARGTLVLLAPGDLVAAARAVLADLG